MPHNAPHGVSMVLAGPSGHLWLCLLCLFESISAHAPGTALRLIRCFATMPTVLHRAFPWYWPVHPDIYGFAFYALYICLVYCFVCLVISGSEDAILRASLHTLLAPPWATILLGIRCFATMPTVLHTAFPWYWPVHPDIYGFALYAFYICLVTALGLNPAADPVFRNYAPQCSTRRFHGTGRSIGTSMALPSMPFREHLCTRSWHRLAVDPVFRNHAHAAPQGFSMVLAGPSRHLWLCLLCLVRLVLPSV